MDRIRINGVLDSYINNASGEDNKTQRQKTIEFYKEAGIEIFGKDDMFDYSVETSTVAEFAAALIMQPEKIHIKYLNRKIETDENGVPTIVGVPISEITDMIAKYFIEDKYSEESRTITDNILEMVKGYGAEYLLKPYEESLIKHNKVDALGTYIFLLCLGFDRSETLRNHDLDRLVEYINRTSNKKLALKLMSYGMHYVRKEQLSDLFDTIINPDTNFETAETRRKTRKEIGDELFRRLYNPSNYTNQKSGAFSTFYEHNFEKYKLSKSEILSLWVERVIASGDLELLDYTKDKLKRVLKRRDKKFIEYYLNKEMCGDCKKRSACSDIPSRRQVEVFELKLKRKQN